MAEDSKALELAAETRESAFIVIAAFREQGSVGRVVEGLLPRFPNVVVVDDGSDDQTASEAQQAGAHVLRHAINRGQGAALQTGIRYSLRQGARYVVTFDADGQHDPADLPAMLDPIARGEVDICLGSRFLEHGTSVPPLRRLLLKAAILFTWVTSGLMLTDAHNGFRAFSRRAAENLDIRLDRMAHASELLDQIRRMKLPYQEVSVHIRYTDYSMAKGQSSTAALRVAWDYLVARVLR